MADDTCPSTSGISPAGAARRRLITTAGSLFILPVIPSLTQAATIVAVRTWPADEYTRVTLEMDSELKAEHFTLENPDRLVVDIQGLSRSEAHTSELQSLMRISYAVICLNKKSNEPNI